MNVTKIYYYLVTDDAVSMVETHGYGVVRTFKEGERVSKYKFGIFRKEDEPTYSAVDMQTGYRYKTPARTIHEVRRFIETVDLKEQPTIFEPAWKQCMMIRAAYEGQTWDEYFWNPENPKGFNQRIEFLDPDKYTDTDSEKEK